MHFGRHLADVQELISATEGEEGPVAAAARKPVVVLAAREPPHCSSKTRFNLLKNIIKHHQTQQDGGRDEVSAEPTLPKPRDWAY